VKPVEFENLKSLRGCLSQHSRIMVNIATIIQNLPNGVKVHLILYDLAAYDLHTFLNKRPESHEEERLRRHDSGPSKRNNSHDWWAGDLIQESMNLADALDYLHDRLYSGRNLSLVHNDLKPENILVFYHDSINQDERYPVGQWKIADFGLAKMKKKRETQLVEKQSAPRVTKSPHPAVLGADNLLLDITHRRTRSISARDISITTAKRDPGRYTAPEIEAEGKCQQHPKSGDVWAFGCILSEVLAYAIAPHLVAELREECEKPRLQDQRFYDVETRKVKPTVLAWLQDLPNRYQAHPITPREGQTVKSPSWVAGCVELIQSVLEAEPAKRDSAGLIRDRLNKIEEQMSREAKFTLTDRVASTNSSASARDSQSEDTQWLCAPSGSPKSIKFPKIPHIGEVTEHGPNRGTKS
jgi:serine/threonine protein kinase